MPFLLFIDSNQLNWQILKLSNYIYIYIYIYRRRVCIYYIIVKHKHLKNEEKDRSRNYWRETDACWRANTCPIITVLRKQWILGGFFYFVTMTPNPDVVWKNQNPKPPNRVKKPKPRTPNPKIVSKNLNPEPQTLKSCPKTQTLDPKPQNRVKKPKPWINAKP